MIRLFFSVSGTSPRTTRRASPSTIAVLPTPGSPMRTGLFFVRRARIWMARRISSSRPITGSILSSAARAVRSRPYFSRASKEASGVSLVTRWFPRTAFSAVRNESGLMPNPARIFSQTGDFSISPQNRCSTLMNSSFISVALFRAASSVSLNSREV